MIAPANSNATQSFDLLFQSYCYRNDRTILALSLSLSLSCRRWVSPAKIKHANKTN